MEKMTEKDNVNKTISQPKGKYLKDLNPKYKMLEVIFSTESGNMTSFYTKVISYEKALKRFKDYEVLSTCDYEDIKITSVILILKTKGRLLSW